MSKKKIPTFNSIQEEATFWDSHDITNYLDELAVVTGTYMPDPTEKKSVMTIRIAPSLKEEVEKVARGYDISTSSLIRMWIVDQLRTLHGNNQAR